MKWQPFELPFYFVFNHPEHTAKGFLDRAQLEGLPELAKQMTNSA